MASPFHSVSRCLTAVTAALGLAALVPAAMPGAMAQTVHFSTPYQDNPATTSSKQAAQQAQKNAVKGGEHFRARGHRPPPPGYQDVPSTEFENGPDPEHEAHLRSNRDAVTGSNLGKFGSSYQDTNPIQSGQVGDATGNGWVAPRGNGF
ncbi:MULTISPECIES: hypothetical protein [Acetobacteraceae]|uniref:Uncharacterized protein n=3 Tax=Acetobacteraceae TaxID=433 RepID=A0A7U7G6V7_9PROT|nr:MULTISPECIES: hypothetical protein [Acetobacteraceae]MCQ0041593.1 hypothetical protein [Bombella sp.]MCT6813965.1 hypothetical protein [Bombella apis]MCT6819869.1 hypothetical protein [Bombella apis]MCT6845582.1 hypothetical protein [Bombella apis]CDG34214.1 FIG00688074: hypothetical protein [Parasaccharibacter apium]